MPQAINLFYAYFRFYVDVESIEEGLDKYCKQFTSLAPVGYNYLEYKCYTNNPLGLEKWCGNMQGYLKTERDSGFIDGVQSDAVNDQTLLMGSFRYIGNSINALKGFPLGTRYIFRKIVAQDSGIDKKVNFSFGDSQKIIHPVMYTLDYDKMEIVKKREAITDSSTVDSYDISVDIDRKPVTGSIHSQEYLTITDYEKMYSGDSDTYTQLRCVSGDPDGELILDMESITDIYISLYNHYGSTGYASTRVYYSETPDNWTQFANTGSNEGRFEYSVQEIEARYIRILVDKFGSGNTGVTYIYNLIAG